MGIVLWIVLFLVLTGICAWIVFGDGVETVTGLVAAILLGADITRWSDRGIRLLRAVSSPGLRVRITVDDESDPEALRLAVSVYDGRSDGEITEIEGIVLDRRSFFGERSDD